ncbi:hypothetical protein CN689_01005 [Peribacillus butanolivorans]|uniref:Apea-like HEPN domain-containing protein n=1 Tax=Peribacillus butanolivorans TaxID=421767 RepID=A0AAX0S832_9BACI|nr:hypothetical protein [Peribacillus butanolivorans]PEJ37510.1 hypothetical protein CN689_01005 [Peribacillus butanolivorans]
MMGLYGHRNLNDKLLQEWILNWNDQKYVDYVNSNITSKSDEFNKHLVKHIQLIKEIASQEWSGEKGYFFDSIIQYMNQFIFNCYFRASSSIASVANFHEILIEPSDYYTNKCLIKGFDYVEKGNIYISYSGEVIGNIGTMSDLFWHSFYDEYILQDDFGGINHTRNNEQDFTLQIWKSYNLEDINELEELVEKILYDCSIKLGLNFKRAKFDSFQKAVGQSNQYSLEVSEDNNYERTPIQYFNFANYTSIGRHKYLAYYQVIEFYFIRAMKKFQLFNSKELDYVKYILTFAVENAELLEWLYSEEELVNYYTTKNNKYSSIVTLDLNRDLLDLVAKRIYYTRCSLVHSKEASQDFNFVPNLNDLVLEREVPLIKFLASKVIEKWSNI